MTNLTIGIDPGLSGGIAVLSGMHVLQLHKMPVIKNGTKKVIDTHALVELLQGYDHAGLTVIEKVHAMPKQGVSSTFTFGFGCGILEGVLAGLSMPMAYVTPQAWQKSMFNGIDAALGKKRSTAFARKRWPSVKKWNDGMADAACIALWGAERRLAESSKFSEADKRSLMIEEGPDDAE